MSAFAALSAALDRLADSGSAITVWWRDDDAVAATPALDRLLAVAGDHAVPLALAVIPARLQDSLGPRLAGLDGRRWPDGRLSLLQHGYSHTNHAPDGEKKCELGPHRPLPLTHGDLATGWARLQTLATAGTGPARLLPVLVPPWNRIAPGLIPALPEMGYGGLSRFGRRARPRPLAGLLEINCHLDPVDWRGRHGPAHAFMGEAPALAPLLEFTAALGTPDLGAPDMTAPGPAAEPFGLLTHHLDHDHDGWRFLQRLIGLLC
ncbi:MAG: polysaccharide deacetylase family protein, partial [Alphaproteobacteria bacterium]